MYVFISYLQNSTTLKVTKFETVLHSFNLTIYYKS